MAGLGRDYIMLRSSRTLQCMTIIKNGTPTWEWSELSVTAFNTKYQECIALLATESDEMADATGARGTRDQNLDLLRDKSRLALTIFKAKYRNNPAKLRLFSNLVMKSDKIAGLKYTSPTILDEV